MVEKSHTSGFWPSLYDPLRHMGARLAEWIAPLAEASGNEDHYKITVELPGVAEDDIDLNVEDGVVTLKGQKRTEREESGDTWFFCERQYGSFSRSFRLPPDADPKGVNAALKDGVLTISIRKRRQETPEATKVKIATG